MAAGPRVDIIIIGAGGTGADVAAWIQESPELGSYRLIGFLDDAPEKQGTLLGAVRVLGPLRAAQEWPDARFVNTIGSPGSFSRRHEVLTAGNIHLDQLETLMHPRAVVARGASVGRGSIVYPHVMISPGARVGNQVVLLANVVVNHDVVIGDCTIVASGTTLSGRARLGRDCYIGAGAHVIQDASVGDGALVGMGSVVVRSVPPGTVVAGNPARVLRALDHR